MAIALRTAKVVMLVKALPQRSARHGETVCCAGITVEGEWKRLFPIRYRHLNGDSSFKRWDWVDFAYTAPTSDKRRESCRVAEESIRVSGALPASQRSDFLKSLVQPSVKAAAEAGHSLALIRPKETRFFLKRKSADQLEQERQAYRSAAAQTSLFDKDLAAMEPTPYEFKFSFRDDCSSHEYTNGDWEAHAMFFNGRRRGMTESEALNWIKKTFEEDYPRKGMLFAVGNQAKRPQTWQLLGVLRVDDNPQLGLAL